jgi:hypothetical protein
MFMPQSTVEHLASLGVTVKDAREFVMSHLDDIGVVFNAAHEHGITNEMLAQIVGGEITGLQVAEFMSAHGFDSNVLDQLPALADNPQDVASVVGVAHQNEHAVHDV